ncbi:hypothetical protein EVAR_24044_1 [Eumeta japonica]|uniref:Uncharacterized protein n=1 Tax=Eumeta variegata TaxID=151549 RepID=A0A4C1VUY8_EUMVA|nr:hypothetical protein EVAR_24044_1 [Eumeta japonica]
MTERDESPYREGCVIIGSGVQILVWIRNDWSVEPADFTLAAPAQCDLACEVIDHGHRTISSSVPPAAPRYGGRDAIYCSYGWLVMSRASSTL